MSAAQDTYRNKYLTNHTKIRECASAILHNMHEGIKEKPKGFSAAHIRSAYKLLNFEGLISRRNEFVLNARGSAHIKNYGFVVYPLDIAKNPR